MEMTLSQALEINARQQAQLAEMADLYAQAQQQIGHLEHRLADLMRRLFGSRSERYEPNQFVMDEILKAGEQAAEEPPAPAIAVKATERRKAAPHGRSEIPEHFEREDIVLDIPEGQKVDAQGHALVMLREEISEKIAWRPGCWYARRYIRPVYVEADRQGDGTVLSAPMPDSPIDKCKADNSVLALVAVKKWCDHLPVYRQQQIFLREGFKVATTTLDAWAIEPILACEKLYEALKTRVLGTAIVHSDDSPVDLQVAGRGNTKQARLWVYLAAVGPPLRFFDFSTDRCKERPAKVLMDFKGFLHVDAYGGYDSIFNNSPGIIEVGCWAHARRKFDEAKGSSPLPATEMLGRIQLLYQIERRVKDATAEERLAIRQSESVPILDGVFERAREMAATALPSSPLGKALTYAHNQQQALLRYTTDGRLCIDNNPAENAIRPLAIGRKNWLFAGSERGGKACAIAMSLIHSAKALDINCYDYLHDVYKRIMSHPVNRLHELLPDEWKAAREKKV
ncbi:MAG: IS66 family transposase [Wenzhouxiangella sp.]